MWEGDGRVGLPTCKIQVKVMEKFVLEGRVTFDMKNPTKSKCESFLSIFRRLYNKGSTSRCIIVWYTGTCME